MSLSGDDLERATELLVDLKEKLVPAMEELDKRDLPRHIVLGNNRQAREVIDEVTDLIVQSKGLLNEAKNGADIYDPLAIIKATVESLILGRKVQPRTIENTTQTLQVIRAPRRRRNDNSD